MLARMLLAFALLLAACSGAAKAPARPDFETCRGFLETAEVARVTGQATLEQVGRSVTETARMQTPSIRSYCEAILYWPGRAQSVTLAVIRYDSPEAARSRYQRMADGLRLAAGPRFTESALGENSYSAEGTSQGVGNFVGFLRGTDVVSLHTAMPSGGASPTTIEQLVQLAQIVRGRLPYAP